MMLIARIFLPLLAFSMVLAVHATISTNRGNTCAVTCVVPCSPAVEEEADFTNLKLYISSRDYMVGLSYAMAAAFTIYALLNFIRSRRNNSTEALVGGSLLMACIYGAVCFFTGCCGSPMLAVYLSIFGASALGFTKPLILIVTTLSISLGLFRMKRQKPCTKENCSSC